MDAPRGGNLPIPPGTWMHKTRSRKANENAVLSMFKSSSVSWNRRWVWADGTMLHWGMNQGQPEKSFPMSSFTGVSIAQPKRLKADGAPDVFIDFGWEFSTADQTTSFVCESREARDVYLAYVGQFIAKPKLAEVKPSIAPSSPSTARLVADPLQREPSSANLSIAAQAARQAEAGPPPPKQKQQTRYDDEDDEGAGHTAKSERELNNLVGAVDDDDVNIDLDADELDSDDDDDWSADSMSDDDNVGGAASIVGKLETTTAIYDRILTPIAQRAYHHLSFRYEAFKDELIRHGDTLDDIVFSRALIKVAKKDANHEREVVVTRRSMYLFAAATFGGLKCRVIPLDQLVGVLESTLETNLFAILIPSFHDMLLRITPQKSAVPGDEAEVKKQMIAHLYKGCSRLVKREFLFREADNVKELIRRTEDDEHQPLECCEHDRLQTALNSSLYPSFRVNAESKVYFSCHVERINAQMNHSSRLFALTDGGIYLCTADGARVSKRFSLQELAQVKYDADTQSTLLVFVDIDVLLTVRNTTDFQLLIKLVPEVATTKVNRTVHAVPNKTLKSGARLMDAKKLADHFEKAGATTEEGIKRGVNVTRKLMLKSIKYGGKKMAGLGQGLFSTAKEGVDIFRSGITNVGGAFVDNQFTGEFIGLLSHQKRLVFEGVVTMKDEQSLLAIPPGTADTLHLHKSGSMTAAKITNVYYSSRCKVYNQHAQFDGSQTTDLIVVVSDRGVYFFDDPTITDSGFLTSALLKLRTDKGYNVSEKLKWQAVTGIARCTGENNVLAVLTNDEKSYDVMFRVSNAALGDKFVAHFCRQYSALHSKPYCLVMPNYFTMDRVDKLKMSIKKHKVDPEPTVALRRHKVSDVVNAAVEADLVETIRRHGDNKVLFSGIAWRFRGAQIKKGAEKLEKALDSYTHGAESKKNFKSFILIVTNCALYFCSKGENEIVRRTEVRAITKVITSTEDPDALLVMVPSEYDIFVRVEGRAKELVERLQDAYAEWTNYQLYLPKEGRGSHEITDYVFPVEEKPSLVSMGNLEKPAGFNEAQARRNAADVKRTYLSWFDADMTNAVKVPAAIQKATSWTEEQQLHEERIARVRHSLERAFVFGLRPASCPPMTVLTKVLAGYEARNSIVHQLIRALDTDDVQLYRQALDDAKTLEVGVGRLIQEQSIVYRELQKKAIVLEKIQSILDEYEASLEEKLPELEGLFIQAELTRINAARLAEARHQLSMKLQRRRMNDVLRSTRNPNRFSADSRDVLLRAAERLNVPTNLRSSIIQNDDPMVIWATTLLETAIASGTEKRLKDAMESARRLDPPVVAAIESGPLAVAQKEMKLLIDAAPTIAALESLCGDLRTSLSQLPALRLVTALQQLEKLEVKLKDGRSLAKHRSLVEMYIERVEERLGIVESKEARKAEEHAAATEYRERVRQRELEQERIFEEQRQQRDQEDRRRREKMSEEWAAEADRLLYTMKQHVASEEYVATSNCIRACDSLAKHIVEFVGNLARTTSKEASPRSTSPAPPAAIEGSVHPSDTDAAAATAAAVSSPTTDGESQGGILAAKGHISVTVAGVSLQEQQTLQPAIEKTIAQLRTARQVGALYLAKLRERKSRVLPPALLAAIRQLNTAAVVQYIDSMQGRGLTTEAVAEIREGWLKADREARWVRQLHARIHQAVALRNLKALEEQLNLARSKSHSDAVVSSAWQWLEAQQQLAAEQSTATGIGEVDGDASAELIPTLEQGTQVVTRPSAPPPPKPIVFDLMHGWPPKAPKSLVVTNASTVTKSVVSHPGNTRSPTSADMLRLHCHATPTDATYKQVLDAWHALLSHRIKPSGLFRKTERTLVDVLAFIGGLQRKGDIVAPFSNHLVAEFDRVKKLNHAHGSSPSLLLVRFLFQKGDVLRFIEDLFVMLPKEAEDIFLDDSVWRSPSDEERKDLRLMAKMIAQVEWPFSLEDKGDSALLRGSQAASLDEAALLTADKEQRTAIRAIQSLRRSISRLSTHFSKEMNKLGSRPDASSLALIFDENNNKAIGLLVRESLCAAISSLLLVGFRTSHMFVKRHLWDLFKAAAERLRQSARGLGGVALPDAIDMVENLTDVESVSKKSGGATMANMTETQLNDVRVRMLYSHALNQQALSGFLLDAVFDQHGDSSEFLEKYYHMDKAVLLQEDTREEVTKILRQLCDLPFVISIDAELW
jgi:hypothetical protein